MGKFSEVSPSLAGWADLGSYFRDCLPDVIYESQGYFEIPDQKIPKVLKIIICFSSFNVKL